MAEQQQQTGRIIAKAWADEAFKAALIADPIATLKAEGIPVPEGLSLTVVENTSAHLHLVLPPKPQEGEISEDALSSVAGGMQWIDGCALNGKMLYVSMFCGFYKGSVNSIVDY